MNDRTRRSSSKSPFGSFREIGLRVNIDDGILAGTTWTSPPCKEFFVFWEDVWNAPGRNHLLLSRSLALTYANSDLPLVTVLVSACMNMWDFLKQLDATPTVQEISAQLSALRVQVERLGSIAQGGSGREAIGRNPNWMADTDGYGLRGEVDRLIRAAEGRSASLHPILKYWIEIACTTPMSDDLDDIAHEQAGLRDIAEQRKLIKLFDRLPELVQTLYRAEQLCREDGGSLHRESRTQGAPGDVARDWLFVQLMWIWRDVLGKKLAIYAKRIRAGVELDAVEPQGCMAFIVALLDQFEPIRPHQLSALERKLIDLAKLVPEAKLAVPVSREK